MTSTPHAPDRQGGFTLIELMVTVAVIGILAAIAYPSFTDYIRRGKISDATSQLGTLRVQLEQYYQDNKNYGSTATACGVAMPTSSNFTFSCTWGATSSSQSFLATATGNASAGMSGYVFTVNDANLQQTTQYAGNAVTVNCWMKSGSDTC